VILAGDDRRRRRRDRFDFASFRMGMRGYVAAVINGSMQLTVFDHLERLPYSYYKKNKSGDLIQTCTRDLDVLRKFLIADVSELQLDLLDGHSSASRSWMSISWKITLVACLIPLMFLYSFFLIKKCATSTGDR
jgi:ATP-binding cassette subfamily B protein